MKKKKIFAVIALTVMLAACNTTRTVTQPVVTFQRVDIPSQFLDCKDRVIKVPNPKTLTNKQISQYILKSKELIAECQNDVGSIDQYISEYNLEVDRINERLKNGKNQ